MTTPQTCGQFLSNVRGDVHFSGAAGQDGVAQYVFALLRALQAHAAKHAFTIFVLEEDLLQARKFDWHRRRGLTMNVYVGNAEKG